jgi:polyhydroxyalkanoate synthesis repressor PhaR
MSETGVIELRRYPSRKLYNKSASSYVRLQEVAEMIRAGAAIHVEDTETGEDVTRQVLLQIIMEQENQSDRALLSADLLTDMIRMHQSKASEVMTSLFEQTVAFMRAQQDKIANQMTQGLSGGLTGSMPTPWSMWDPAQMQDMQREFQQRLAGFWTPPSASKPAEAARPRTEPDELKALRERLDELEKKVGKR